jgi:RHH-type proline utilization regulon transcriptional repressor/proline dehydrogenase/delta 1-pyrroline-5-carboxylate dehydrogenase
MLTTPTELAQAREAVRAGTYADEATLVPALAEAAGLDEATRVAAAARAAALVEKVRAASTPGLMETFLAEYGLSTDEGIALMCLAEALLRVPDAETIDALIEDKIAPGDWGRHLGRSSSSLVNASTWALLVTGRVLDERGAGIAGALRGAIRRLGEPVIRAAVAEAMRRLGRQFVLGETIEGALSRAETAEAKGYTYSYDMLGEAARTHADAARYRVAYERAVDAIADHATSDDPRRNPGISIKLSALHPRYEFARREEAVAALVPVVLSLCQRAAAGRLGLNIDAEEQDRLDLSLDIIERVAADPSLAGWDGFGVVVQAYGRRARPKLLWLDALARATGRRIMVRLVKGAYWDTEVKRAQVIGAPTFPVFTRKAATDVSYLACARTLLERTDRLYPQFATHNAHTVAAVLAMADVIAAAGGATGSAASWGTAAAAGEAAASTKVTASAGAASVGTAPVIGTAPEASTAAGAGTAARAAPTFEFQRLHGMGEALYEVVRRETPVQCRIYAPVGAHEDLLAYLVRRLLENGANSSFANQIVNHAIPAHHVGADPFATLAAAPIVNRRLRQPAELYGDARPNAAGWDLTDPAGFAAFEAARAPFRTATWSAVPMTAAEVPTGPVVEIRNPARPDDLVGAVAELAPEAAAAVVEAARAGVGWADPAGRAAALRRAADLYEAHAGELFALAAREAGKTAPDAVAEVREAVDFLRFYAAEAERLLPEPAGVVVAISPWNFPLAIFTGQIAAALAAGNAVVAKPAEQTPLIAHRAARLLREAGVPAEALQLVAGGGAVGAALTAVPGLAAVAFTGSTATAKAIDRALAAHSPEAVLVAETGGLNAMMVDSTALPEQAIRDAVASAFQSAGQRCSALRVLYLQEDVAPKMLAMLTGAMETLHVGDPWRLATDVGPVIDREAKEKIEAHIARAAADGRVLLRVGTADGLFVPPTVIRIDSIDDLEEEIFGPVLHVATFSAGAIDAVVDAINAQGFGLTFGLHTRIDDRVEAVVSRIRVGNTYVNRNQIGAVVGSQPFGGEGLSGTGPKAGGPHTVARLARRAAPRLPTDSAAPVSRETVARALQRLHPQDGPVSATDLPGPTGESNRLTTHPRGVVIAAGPSLSRALRQAEAARAAGNAVLVVAPGAGGTAERTIALDGTLDPGDLSHLSGFDAVLWEGDPGPVRRALAAREGRIIPLLGADDTLVIERHLCIDTAAAGGNAKLLSGAEDEPRAA